MRNPFACDVGGVLSADIAVPEHANELGFYSRILTTGSSPLWRDDLSNNRGTPIIGLGARSPEYEALPLQWMPHIQVSDVGASAARALELGGREVLHGKGEDGQSLWAVLVDPVGAAFGLIPVVDVDVEGVDSPKEIGRISWLTLVVADVQPACDFYEQVVGWSSTSADPAGGCGMLRAAGVPAAEIRPAGGADPGIPSVWILSLPVADLKDSLRLVREGGGAVLEGSADAGHAIIQDPIGVIVGLQAND